MCQETFSRNKVKMMSPPSRCKCFLTVSLTFSQLLFVDAEKGPVWEWRGGEGKPGEGLGGQVTLNSGRFSPAETLPLSGKCEGFFLFFFFSCPEFSGRTASDLWQWILLTAVFQQNLPLPTGLGLWDRKDMLDIYSQDTLFTPCLFSLS